MYNTSRWEKTCLASRTSVQSMMVRRCGKFFFSFSVSQLRQISGLEKTIRPLQRWCTACSTILKLRLMVLRVTPKRYARSLKGKFRRNFIKNERSCVSCGNTLFAFGSTGAMLSRMAKKSGFDNPVNKRRRYTGQITLSTCKTNNMEFVHILYLCRSALCHHP